MGRPATVTPLALHQLSGQLLTEQDVEGEHWYDCAPSWPAEGKDGLRASVKEWRIVGEAALSSATRAYEKQVGGGKNSTRGALGKERTIRDKVASLTLRVQESPLHRLEDLKVLQSMAKKKERRESAPAIEALKDLFINDLLPSDRRLMRFVDREFECSKKDGISKRNIAYAVFENELKRVYRDFLGVLEDMGKSNLGHFKEKAVKYISDLLIGKPECEKELLAMLVNKLGDPDRKVSSTTSFNLRLLIEKHHPQMRPIVVKEVEQLIMRTNVTQKAQYYAVNFLNQLQFNADDVDLARWVLRIYMTLFTATLAKSKLPEEQSKEVKKGGAKSKAKKKKGKAGVKQQIKDASSEVKSSRLMGALLIGANRAYPYTKPEQDDTSYQHHYDSLFEVAHSDTLEPATHALAFLHQVSQSESTQGDRFYRALYSRIFDAVDAGEPKQAGFLNLLYKAVKDDTNPRRVKSFVKRLLQAATYGSPSFAGACIVVLSQCFKGKQFGTLKSFVSIAELSDEVELFVDADKESIPAKPEVGSGLDGTGDSEEANDNSAVKEDSVLDLRKAGESMSYDPSKRDPQFSGAEKSRLWELVGLCYHFHPSVSMFAKSMCSELRNFQYPGDPLKDFSLIAFLDKFVYKKPKNRVAKSLYGKRASSYRDDPLPNSREFQDLAKAGNVAEDDKFFIRFFKANPSRVVGDEEEEEEAPDMDMRDDGDSEEEAFEEAMQAEMKRQGADAGFLSAGIKNDFGDVDEDDDEEMKAFEEAFASEFMKSDAEENGSDSENDDAEVKNELEKKPNTRKRKRRREAKETAALEGDVASVFAAAEDYAEAIDRESKKVQDDQLGSEEEAPAVKVTSIRKKVTRDGRPKPRKKRRVKKG